jgi:hypothetical protein
LRDRSATTVSDVKQPFWAHQIVEYLFGLGAIAIGAHSPQPLVPCIAGALLLLNASATDGPLSAFRVVGRRTHRIFDIVVIVLLFAWAVLGGRRIDSTGRVVLIGLAIVHSFVTWRTDFTPKVKTAPMRFDSDGVGRIAGHLSGKAYRAVRDKRK